MAIRTAAGIGNPIRHTAHRREASAPVSDLATRLYGYTAKREGASREELHIIGSAPPDEVEDALQQLIDLGLLNSHHDAESQDERLTAIPPATAGAQFLLPAIRELRDRQRTIDDAYAGLTALIPVYESSALGDLGKDSVQVVPDLGAVRQLITELSTRATSEVLTSQPGGARPEHVLSEATARTTELLKRGVRMRTLYHHTAQFSQPTLEHVGLITELGAEVRTVNDAFMRLLVFDGEVAVIPLQGHPTGAALIRDPSVVDFAVASFERAWASATPLPHSYSRSHVVNVSEDLKLALLRLLTEGHEDKVIAKRLGMSLRTYQRHLSAIMSRIGARNRLHAGYLIHKLQLLERDS